jgi:hypothetical protein
MVYAFDIDGTQKVSWRAKNARAARRFDGGNDVHDNLDGVTVFVLLFVVNLLT